LEKKKKKFIGRKEANFQMPERCRRMKIMVATDTNHVVPVATAFAAPV
jgi:hypothetical protein